MAPGTCDSIPAMFFKRKNHSQVNPGAARVNIITTDSKASCWPCSPHFPRPRSSAPRLHPPAFLACHLCLRASQPLLIPTGAPCPPGPCLSGMPSSLYLLGGKSQFSSPMSQAHPEFSTPTGQTAPPAPPGPQVFVTAPSRASGSCPRPQHHPSATKVCVASPAHCHSPGRGTLPGFTAPVTKESFRPGHQLSKACPFPICALE